MLKDGFLSWFLSAVEGFCSYAAAVCWRHSGTGMSVLESSVGVLMEPPAGTLRAKSQEGGIKTFLLPHESR